MSLFDELKRRNVLRVAIAYLAAAWLIIQIVETLFPVYGLSDRAIQITVSVLAVGFIPALILAWVFELTPAGVKRDKNVGRGESFSTRNFDRIIIVTLVLAIGYFAVDKFVLDPARDAARETAIAEQARTDGRVDSFGDRSIAVLPFVNMSSDPEQKFFSDGISEELLNLLARIPELRVISRSSAFSFRDDNLDVPTIAKKLNVAHVLEGSVRKSGNSIRITAQLIEARSDTHIWSQTFDRELDDIFAIQDEIASEVVAQLKLELLGPIPDSDKTDPESYSLYLQALHIWNNRLVESYDYAETLLDQVLESDPDYVPAWTLLAALYAGQIDARERDRESGRLLVRQLVDRAASINPRYYRVLGFRAWIADAWDNDLAKSARLYQESLSVRPADVETLRLAGQFASKLGRHKQATEIAEFVVARDPMCLVCNNALVNTYYDAGRMQDVLDAVGRMRRLGFDANSTTWIAGHSHLLIGQPQAALEEYSRISSQLPGPYMQLHGSTMALYDLERFEESNQALAEYLAIARGPGMRRAEVHAWRGAFDLAFEHLNTLEPGRFNYDSPLLRNLHDDPRWEPLLKRLGRSREERDAIEFNIALPSADRAQN